MAAYSQCIWHSHAPGHESLSEIAGVLGGKDYFCSEAFADRQLLLSYFPSINACAGWIQIQ